MKKQIEVVAALIRENDKFLICQRPKDKACGLLWEFVGGKVEKGESKQEALIRECYEELKIAVEVGAEFCALTHEYPNVVVNLTLFNARISAGVIQKIEHNDVKWITKEQIDDYEFCPADVQILSLIKSTF